MANRGFGTLQVDLPLTELSMMAEPAVPRKRCATPTNSSAGDASPRRRAVAAQGRCRRVNSVARGLRLGLDERDAHACGLDGGELGLVALAVGDELVDALDVANARERDLADLGTLGHGDDGLGVRNQRRHGVGVVLFVRGGSAVSADSVDTDEDNVEVEAAQR